MLLPEVFPSPSGLGVDLVGVELFTGAVEPPPLAQDKRKQEVIMLKITIRLTSYPSTKLYQREK